MPKPISKKQAVTGDIVRLPEQQKKKTTSGVTPPAAAAAFQPKVIDARASADRLDTLAGYKSDLQKKQQIAQGTFSAMGAGGAALLTKPKAPTKSQLTAMDRQIARAQEREAQSFQQKYSTTAGKAATTAALNDLKKDKSAKGQREYNWLNQNQYYFWTEDELKAGIKEADKKAADVRQTSLDQKSAWTDASLTPAQQAERFMAQQKQSKSGRKAASASESMRRALSDITISKELYQMPEQLRTDVLENSGRWQMEASRKGANNASGMAYRKESEQKLEALKTQLKNRGYSDEKIDYLLDYGRRLYNNEAVAQQAKALQRSGFGAKAAASVASVPLNLAGGGIGYLDLLAQRITAKTDPFTGQRQAIDYNSRGQLLANTASTIRQTISADMAPGWSFLYNTGMSILDFLAASGFGAGAEVLLSGSAAQNAAQEAHRRGATDDQALMFGLTSGAFEALFEHVSLEKLRLFQTSAKGVRLTGDEIADMIGKQAFTEGSEELATTLANTIGDAMIMADKSEINAAIRAYRAQGMSEEDATRQAWKDWSKQTMLDFAGGFISGGVTGSATGAGAQARYYGADVAQGVLSSSARDVASDVETALLFPKSSQTYQQARVVLRELAKGKTAGDISPAKIGKLQNLMAQDRAIGYRATQSRDGVGRYEIRTDPADGSETLEFHAGAITNSFVEQGLNPSEAMLRADVLQDMLDGERVTNNQLKDTLKIFSDETKAVFEQMTGTAVPADLKSTAAMTDFYRTAMQEFRDRQDAEIQALNEEQAAIDQAQAEFDEAVEENRAVAAEQAAEIMDAAQAEVDAEDAESDIEQAEQEQQQAAHLETYEEFAERKQAEYQQKGRRPRTDKQLQEMWQAETTGENGILLDDGTTIGREEFYKEWAEYFKKTENHTPTEEDLEDDYQAFRAASRQQPISRADWEESIYGKRPETEATTAEEAPAEEAPAAPEEQAPVEEAPVEEAPVEEAPVEEAPVEEAPVEEAPVEEAPVEEAPAAEEQPKKEPKQPKKEPKQQKQPTIEPKLPVVKKATKAEPPKSDRPLVNNAAEEKAAQKKVFGSALTNYLHKRAVATQNKDKAPIIRRIGKQQYISISGVEIIPLTDEMVDFAADSPAVGGLGANVSDTGAAAMKPVVEATYDLVVDPPVAYKSEETGVTLFEFKDANGEPVYFYKDFLSYFDGALLYLQRGKGRMAALKAVNKDGTVRGWLLPNRSGLRALPNAVKTDATLKSFSPSMTREYRFADPTSGPDQVTGQPKFSAYDPPSVFGGLQESDKGLSYAQMATLHMLKKFLKPYGEKIKDVVFDSARTRGQNAVIADGVIYLNEKKLRNAGIIYWAIGHELTHPSSASDASLAKDIVDTITQLAKDGAFDGSLADLVLSELKDPEAAIDVRTKKYTELYQQLGYGPEKIKNATTKEKMREEVAGDWMGYVFMSQPVLERLAGVKPHIITRALRAINRLRGTEVNALVKNGKGYKQTVKTLEDLADRMQTALKNAETIDGEERYSLASDTVITPTNGGWEQSRTSAWIREHGYDLYGDTGKKPKYDKDGHLIEEQHPTQNPGATVASYQKYYDMVKEEHPDNWKDLRVLDASSGYGLGTQLGRDEGFNVTDAEPYPAANRDSNGKYVPRIVKVEKTGEIRPAYRTKEGVPNYGGESAYTDMIREGKKFDVILSNCVLNVVPQDQRNDVLLHMRELLAPGGEMFINVRSDKDIGSKSNGQQWAKDAAAGKPKANVQLDKDGLEWFLTRTKAYQKGFAPEELRAYVSDALGPGYRVEVLKKTTAGEAFGSNAAVVHVVKEGDEKFSASDLPALTEKQEENRQKNDKLTVIGSPLRTLNGSTIKRYKGIAGKEVGGQVYVHRDYASRVVPEQALAQAEQVLAETHPDFEYRTVMYDKNKNTVRFDEAPDFDTAREPIPGNYVTVNLNDGSTKTGYSDYIWHHKWLWVQNDYKGFDVKKSWEWSRQWLNVLRATDDKVSNRGIANGSGHGTANWNAQLEYFGLPLDDEEAKFSATEPKLPGRETAVYIPNAVNNKTGEKISFVDLILDGRKTGETRPGRGYIPVGKWVGLTSGGKNPKIVGRVVFGEPYEITNQSPEYKTSFIKDTEYDLGDGETKLYYPVVQYEDFRNNPVTPDKLGQRPVYQYGGERFSATELPKAITSQYEQAVRTKNREEAQRLVDEAAKLRGYPKAGFHGTLNGGFTQFDKYYSHIGGNSGAGFYFSSNVDDATGNYSDIEGADNYFKASNLASQIMDAGEWNGQTVDSWDDALRIAKDELKKNPMVYNVFLDLGDTYVRDFRDSTNIYDRIMSDFDDSSYDREDYDTDDDFERDLYYARDEHLYMAISRAISAAFNDIEQNYELMSDVDLDALAQELTTMAEDYGSLTWEDISRAVADRYIDLLTPDQSETTDGTPEITRAIIEGFGFNSITDREVSRKFDQVRNLGEGAGSTEHYIVFAPEQIKSAEPFTYDDKGKVIPIEDRFRPDHKDIRFSAYTPEAVAKTDRQYEAAVRSGDMKTAQRMVDEAARRAGWRPTVVYHGTDNFGFTRFDMNKGDGFSIWLTEALETAETYSGSPWARKISDTSSLPALPKPLDQMSLQELVDWHNKALPYADKIRPLTSSEVSWLRDQYVQNMEKPIQAAERMLENPSETLDPIFELFKFSPELKQTVLDYLSRIADMRALMEEASADSYTRMAEITTDASRSLYDRENNDWRKLSLLQDLINARELVNTPTFAAKLERIVADGQGVYWPGDTVNAYTFNFGSEDSLRTQIQFELENEETNRGNYQLYVRMDNPLVIDAQGEDFQYVEMPDSLMKEIREHNKMIRTAMSALSEEDAKALESQLILDKDFNWNVPRSIARAAKKLGYDGVQFVDIVDDGGIAEYGTGMIEPATNYAVFDAAAVKSADPVTYDDKGDVIPLSERFNPESDDIRFSVPGNSPGFDAYVKKLQEERRKQFLQNNPPTQRPSQTNSTNPLLTDEEKEQTGRTPGNITHTEVTDEAMAQMVEYRLQDDFEGEKRRLFRKDKKWDASDLAVAEEIIRREVDKARETGDFSEARRLLSMHDSQMSDWGLAGHTAKEFANSMWGIVNDATSILDDSVEQEPANRGKRNQANKVVEGVSDAGKDALEKTRQEMEAAVKPRRGNGKGATTKDGRPTIPDKKTAEEDKEPVEIEGNMVGEPFTFEYADAVGTAIGKSIANRATQSEKAKTFLQELQSHINRFATERLPKRKTKMPTTPTELLREYIQNREFYEQAWAVAQDEVRRQLKQKGMDEVPEQLEGFLGGWFGVDANGNPQNKILRAAITHSALSSQETADKIRKQAALGSTNIADIIADDLIKATGAKDEIAWTIRKAAQFYVDDVLNKQVTVKGKKVDYDNEQQTKVLDNMVTSALREIGRAINASSMQKLGATSAASKAVMRDAVINTLTRQYGVAESDAERVADIVGARFDTLLREGMQKRLKSIFKERNLPDKTKQQTFIDRVIELTNLGALESKDYHDAAVSKLLDGYKTRRGVTVDDVLAKVYDYASRVDTIPKGDIVALKDLVSELNAERWTGGLIKGNEIHKTLQKIIDRLGAQPEGDRFLRQLIAAQVRGIANDNAHISAVDAINAERYLAMLSKLTTVARNIAGNTAFDLVETISNNTAATPIDMLMSLATKRRTTTTDKSYLGKAKRQGSVDGFLRAVVEIALDAPIEDGTNRWEMRNGRTFKMAKPTDPNVLKTAGNAAERLLSTWEKWQRYLLTATDEFAKGGTREERQRQIDYLKSKGLLEEDALQNEAQQVALERTFQNEGAMTTMMDYARNALNVIGVNDSHGTRVGLGTALMPFARVPANIAGQVLNYSPAGLVKGTIEVLNVMSKGKNATAEEQAKAARDFGRGVNGTGLIALFMAAALKGLLRVSGDSGDKDKDALERDQGMVGTQLNIDALKRWAKGESPEWRDGDTLVSVGGLEPLNGPMAFGAFLADSYKDDATFGDWLTNTANASLETTLQVMKDLPAMSQISSIANAYKYSDEAQSEENPEGGPWKQFLDAGAQGLSDVAASGIPNILTGVAQAMDEGRVRTPQTSEKRGLAALPENTLNAFKMKLPGLRSTLPQALDSFGQPRQTTAGKTQNALNSNVLPFAITAFRPNAVSQELVKLKDSGEQVTLPPHNPPKSVNTATGKKYLTPAEKRAYQQKAGGMMYNDMVEAMNNRDYQKGDGDFRADVWRNLKSYATAEGKISVGGKAEIPEWSQKGSGSTAQKAIARAFVEKMNATLPQAGTTTGQKMQELIKYAGGSDAQVRNLFAQLLDNNSDRGTLKKIDYLHTEAGGNYSYSQIAAFYNAKNEKVREREDGSGGEKLPRKKDELIEWATNNGFSKAQAEYLYKIFNGDIKIPG